MGEASRIAQVPPYTLRYWEARIGYLRPSRRSSGHRRFSRADLETIFLVKDLIQRRKLTAAGARRALIEHRKGKPAAVARQAAADGSATGAMPVSALKLLREVRKEIQSLMHELK